MRVNAFWLAAGRKLCAKMRLSGLTHIRLSGSELVAQKIEVDVRVVAAPVHVLAVDDPRLNRMENQLAPSRRLDP